MNSRLLALVLLSAAVIAGAFVLDQRDDPDDVAAAPGTTTTTTGETGSTVAGSSSSTSTTATTAPTSDFDGWADPALSGQRWQTEVRGLLTFRGNPTRSYMGDGPVPRAPEQRYQFPSVQEGPMCRTSTNLGETKTWCGQGWTGQVTIARRAGPDGTVVNWAVFGAYDGNVHFVNADTGERLLPDFETGDIIKGTPTIDPDGFPIVYSGSRDNKFRIIAIDQAEPIELWSMDADDFSPVLWNDDWDSSPMIIDDYLFEGGENSRFFMLKLNRAYGADGKVTVDPEIVFHTAAWDQQLLSDAGDDHMSVENSPTVVGNTVYFANSGGLVQGWDISGLKEGVEPTRVFRYWTGDDTDATIVADSDGMLYVGVEYERSRTTARTQAEGQLIKLDPSKPDNPRVWGFDDHGALGGGIWSTPAVVGDVVYTSTNGGRLAALDKATGNPIWIKELPGPLWGSPVVVDGVLLEGDCEGVFHAYDVSDPTIDPPELWSIDIGGCIEATPAVWLGRVFIGTRNGYLHMYADPGELPQTPTVGNPWPFGQR